MKRQKAISYNLVIFGENMFFMYEFKNAHEDEKCCVLYVQFWMANLALQCIPESVRHNHCQKKNFNLP